MDLQSIGAIVWPILIFGILRGLEYWIVPKFYHPNETAEVKALNLARQVEDLENKNKDLEANQKLLLQQLGRANVKIEKQQEQINFLTSQLEQLRNTIPLTPVETTPFKGRILGIWPELLPLDTKAERDAIISSGLEYEALEGDQATREGIVEQLSQKEYSILEIGARGGEEGIKLKDGIAPPKWWMQLAKQHHIQVFVVLANESSKPGVGNVADALFNAGADSVISVDSKILDEDAIRFAKMFYRRLSRGVPLAKAVEYAKLVISDSGADTVKLRTK